MFKILNMNNNVKYRVYSWKGGYNNWVTVLSNNDDDWLILKSNWYYIIIMCTNNIDNWHTWIDMVGWATAINRLILSNNDDDSLLFKKVIDIIL